MAAFTNIGDFKNGPLQGVRVLDLSRILAGPTCTQLLGDMGADIIKIERPGLGDDTRAWGPPFVVGSNGQETNESAYYLSTNRNKRSIALDISKAEDIQILKELVATCDIFIENFKVGGLKKYGLSYDQLKEEFPGLVYCSITGFGQTGPNADKAGYDLLAQGFGGIMSLTGTPDGEPMKVAVGISDVMTGMYATAAILAALRFKDKTGLGQYIDIALADVQTAWLVNEGTNFLLSNQLPKRQGNQHPNITPYQVFEVADGYVIIAVGNDAQYIRFCKQIGADELATDQKYLTNSNRLAHRDELINQLIPILLKFTKQDLIQKLVEVSVPAGPINNLEELFSSDQVKAREMKISMPHSQAKTESVSLIGNPIKFSKTPVTYRMSPPTCGGNRQDILEELERLKQPESQQNIPSVGSK